MPYGAFGAIVEPMIYQLGETVYFWMSCTDPTTGAAANATGTPAFAVYRGGTSTPVETGTLSQQNSQTGWYLGSVTLDSDYAVDTVYEVRGSATVNAVSQAGPLLQFVVRAAPALSSQSQTIISDIAALPTAADNGAATWTSTTGAKIRKLLLNRYVRAGNVCTVYEDDSATTAFTQGYSVTSTGFDRSKSS